MEAVVSCGKLFLDEVYSAHLEHDCPGSTDLRVLPLMEGQHALLMRTACFHH